MEKAQELVDYLRSKELKVKLENMLDHMEVLNDEDKLTLVEFFDQKTLHTSQSITDIVLEGDEDEFSDLMVTIWLEARLEWNRYNCQMQYQTFSKGQAEPVLMAKGACLAEIIDCIEQRINAQDLYWVLKIAVNPIGSVSYRVKQTQKLIEKTSNYGKISQGIINTQLEMLDRLNENESNKKIVQKYKGQITRTMNSIEDSGFLEISDFADCIENSVIKGMKRANLQFQVSYTKPKLAIGVPPEIVQAIDLVLSKYIDNLVEHSMEQSPEQREGKSPFVNFSWRVDFDKDSFHFFFQDDGLGKSEYADFKLGSSELDLTAHIENRVGEGSEVSLTFAFFAVHEFVAFELIKDNKVETFAIPASKVKKLIKGEEIRTKDNYHQQIVEANGDSVKRLKWPPEFSDEEEYKNLVFFEDQKKRQFSLECGRFIGFFQSKLKRSCQQSLCGQYFVGFIEKDGNLVKVLDTDEIAKDIYESSRSNEILLPTG